ncbi:MAG: c-type cytochrome [Geminicoccaceae bacterium]
MCRFVPMMLVGLVGIAPVALFGLQEAIGQPRKANADDAAQVALGETVYRAACAECHGTVLEGRPNWQSRLPDGTMPAPPHDDSGHTWHHPDQQLFDYTKLGGAAVVPAPFKSAMPGFADTLTDDEIWAVLAFIKSSWSPRMREIQQQRSTQQ